MQHLSVLARVSVLGHTGFCSDTVFCFVFFFPLFYLGTISLNIAYHAGKTHADDIA